MQRKTDTRLATVVAALASAGAACIHLAVTPGHWQEWMLSGLFFVLLALFQLGWAATMMLAPRRSLLVVGIAANIGVIALWAVTRTWGLPFGPHAGDPEAVGVAGSLTTVLEIVVVLTAAWGLLPRRRASVFAPWSYRLALGGAAVLVVAAMAPGVVAGLDHSHDGAGHGGTHDHDGPAEHHGTTGRHEPAGQHETGSAPTSPPSAAVTTTPPVTSEPHGHSDDHSH
ncbi:hypothetical protein [Amycolatopsis aidingensis]|uniref:hypothetical protein n=1 Tax=Amycolatopsis aidingensis TaxID=2842453 RepID=UPI001C0DA649|nr:hypothetical protein [Amycolatopsis aidingensis]